MNKAKSRISIGDKVWLKSGGPEMLVVDFEWDRAICAYPHQGKIEEVDFRAVCLSKTKCQND